MNRAACVAPPQELLEYWLGELDESHERRMDEHLFACSACSERLRAIVELGAAIRAELLRGTFTFVTSMPFVRRIKDAGLRVREYELEAGGSVACTVTSDDDFVIAHLRAPLGDVRRLDLLIDDTTSGKHRTNDVAFDPAADGLVAVTSTAYLRTLGHSQYKVRLLAIEGAAERIVGDYTFNHFPS